MGNSINELFYTLFIATVNGSPFIVILCLSLFIISKSKWARITISIITILFIYPLNAFLNVYFPEVIDGRYRAYKNFYNEIEVGMKKSEVIALMDKKYPNDGDRGRPKCFDEDGKLVIFMNPEEYTEPNCEGIILKFTNGNLHEKRYSRD